MKRFQKRRVTGSYHCPDPCCDDGSSEAHLHVTGRRPELLHLPALGVQVADALRMG